MNHSLNSQVALGNGLSKKLINLCTGFGIASGIRSYYQINGSDVTDKKVYIQGTGFVGCATACYLHQFGAKIVALSNINYGQIYESGIDQAELDEILNIDGDLKQIRNRISLHEFNTHLKDMKFDIFIPAAASQIISGHQVEEYIDNNSIEMIACGANNPFIEKDFIYGLCSQSIDKKITLLPDFFINSGLAIAFNYMIDNCENNITSEMLFNYISSKLHSQLRRSLNRINYNDSFVTAALLFDFFCDDLQLKRSE